VIPRRLIKTLPQRACSSARGRDARWHIGTTKLRPWCGAGVRRITGLTPAGKVAVYRERCCSRSVIAVKAGMTVQCPRAMAVTVLPD